MWETLRINMEFGIITITEARELQGLPRVSWGKKPWSRSGENGQS